MNRNVNRRIIVEFTDQDETEQFAWEHVVASRVDEGVYFIQMNDGSSTTFPLHRVKRVYEQSEDGI